MLKTASQIANDVIQKIAAGGRPSQAEIDRMKAFGQQQGQAQRQRAIQGAQSMVQSVPKPKKPAMLQQRPPGIAQ